MATNYPTSLDSFTNPTSSSTLNSPSHAAQHANANDAIEAIETKLGVGNHTIGEWVAFTPSFSNFTLGNGTLDANYCRVNDLVFCRVNVTLGSTSSMGTTPSMTLPVTAVSGSNQLAVGTGRMFDSSLGLVLMAVPYMVSTTAVILYTMSSGGSYVARTTISATVPFTWTTGDAVSIHFFYQAA